MAHAAPDRNTNHTLNAAADPARPRPFVTVGKFYTPASAGKIVDANPLKQNVLSEWHADCVSDRYYHGDVR
jgi:hypothetical protein